ncbi:MAG: hypothetical protein AB7F19_02240 [Candidatus Babeliales bacterium]
MLGKAFSIREAFKFGWSKSIEHLFLLLKVAIVVFIVELVLSLGFVPLGLFLKMTQNSYLSVIPLVLTFGYMLAVTLCTIGMIRLGLLRVLFDIYERNTSEVMRLFSSFNLVLTYLFAFILFSLCLLLLILVCALPLALIGVIVGITGATLTMVSFIMSIVLFILWIILNARLGFYPYPIVDTKSTAIASLVRSYEITRGSVLRIIIFEILLGLIPVIFSFIAILNLAAAVTAVSQGWYIAAIVPTFLALCALFCVALMIPFVLLANVYVYKKLAEYYDHHVALIPFQEE